MSRIVPCFVSLVAVAFAPAVRAQVQGPPVQTAPSTGTAAPSAGPSGPLVTPAPADARYGPRQYQLDRTTSRQKARFDEAKYNRYVARIVFGSLATAGGFALLLASGFYALGAAGGLAMFGYCGGEDDCREETAEEERRFRVRAWTTLAFGAASFGIGVPLIVTGAIGRRRQVALRHRTADAGWIHHGAVVVFAGENAGGLRLALEF